MAAESLVHQVETDYFLAGDLSADQIKEVRSVFLLTYFGAPPNAACQLQVMLTESADHKF